jgi:hypothetical protein
MLRPLPSFLSRRPAFTFLEVLLVLAIVGMMVLCLIGFVLSSKTPPLKVPVTTPAPAKATPVPGAAAPAPATPVPTATPVPEP